MDRSSAERVLEYVRSLESLAESIEAFEDDVESTEREVRFSEIPGLKAAIAALESAANGRDEHVSVRCQRGDCGEEFVYCDEGNHFCPYCGESGEDASEANNDDDDL